MQYANKIVARGRKRNVAIVGLQNLNGMVEKTSSHYSVSKFLIFTQVEKPIVLNLGFPQELN